MQMVGQDFHTFRSSPNTPAHIRIKEGRKDKSEGSKLLLVALVRTLHCGCRLVFRATLAQIISPIAGANKLRVSSQLPSEDTSFHLLFSFTRQKMWLQLVRL